jgi:hypothetical protein
MNEIRKRKEDLEVTVENMLSFYSPLMKKLHSQQNG